MSNLHAYFALRNQQGFARALDGSRSQANAQAPGPALSSSGGKSWTRTSALSSLQAVDVNTRDWLGRTALHLACTATEPYALEFVRLLLAHPNINVNLHDWESRWTALHRAFYAGNLAVCMLLLQRSDTDPQLRDYDGYTPLDLYNSTVEGTSPPVHVADRLNDTPADFVTDLFTWGTNRNAALGHGDADDRTYPDQVVIHRPKPFDAMSTGKFTPVRVKAIGMAKLHTTIITDEKRGNIRACGFGSGGRLGSGQHTQYCLLPVPQFTHHVIALALGQDHTLVLTSDNEVLSWGLNRFSQLGYVVEQGTPTGPLHTRAMEEPIQAVPRKVLGSLKKVAVIGVAACKTASACWTDMDVFTWGTNNGQLGYDKAAQPVQVLPRKVTGVRSVTDLAISDSAMVCLLVTKDLICFRDDTHFRVKFPTSEIPDYPRYQHPFSVKPTISKVTCCDDTFAALSAHGDIFTFSMPPASADGVSGKGERAVVKPQKVWSMRKAFDPAKDIALGSDGDIILCTEAGHVFVRSRHLKGGAGSKSLKFHRVPLLHRAVRVCANSTGAFAALRLNDMPRAIVVSGPSLTDDLSAIRPWMRFLIPASVQAISSPPQDEDEDGRIGTDVASIARLCALLAAEKESQKREGRGLFRGPARLAYGADMFVQAAFDIPVHRVVLAARSTPFRSLIEGSISIIREGSITARYHRKGAGLPRLTVTGCHTMSVLLMLEYLYVDDVPALWDRRVSMPCTDLLGGLKVNPSQVKTELEVLARIFAQPALFTALSASAKSVLCPTLNKDIGRLFQDAETWKSFPMKPDVVLELADKSVACHSVILRARSQFFQNFFDDEDWTINRRTSEGVLNVDLKHLEWRAMSFVMDWMCLGEELELFDDLTSVDTVQDLLELVFSVMAAASELLLDKLMLICSAVIFRHVTLHNASSLLADAAYYNALQLVDSLQAYIVRNIGAILESHLLNNLDFNLIKDLSGFVRKRQTEMSPVMRSNLIGEDSLRRNTEWLELQDIPQPLVRNQRRVRDSPKLSPIGLGKATLPRRASGPIVSPLSSPHLASSSTKLSPPKLAQGDDIFAMEEVVDAIPALNIGQPRTPPSEFTVPATVWKSKVVQAPPRVDMKLIMAEAESSKPMGTAPSGIRAADQVGAGPFNWSQKPSQRERRTVQQRTLEELSEPLRHVSSSGSPWKLYDQPSSMSTSPVTVHVPQTMQQSTAPAHMDTPLQIPSSGYSHLSVPKMQAVTPASILHTSNHLLHPRHSSALPGLPLTGTVRRSSDAPAWTKATLPATLAAPIPSGLSFVAIQQQQRDQDLDQDPNGKRSLREIQEEEQALREEEDFLKWWTAEEQRLKEEAEGEAANLNGPSNKRGRSPRRGGRGGRGRGDGGGRGGNVTAH